MIASILIAFKIVLLFIFSWNSRFVMDEFVQLGWAKYLGNGLFDTVWHGKAVGYVVFYKLAHSLGWDATSIVLIGRMQTALLTCATLGIIYASAKVIGENRLRALAIVLVLLCFSNFIERSFRTIAEPLALFFAAAALLVVIRGQADKARTILIAGVLSGLSFLATQKAAYFNAALGIALVGDSFLARRYAAGIARGAWLVLGWSFAIAVYCLIFGGTNPVPILHNLIFGPAEVATKGADAYVGGLRGYVRQTLFRNFILYFFSFAGILISLMRIRSLTPSRRIALIFTLVITALVFAHNQPWPYVFIMALPFMALWSLVLLDRIAHARLYWWTAVTVMGIAVVFSFIRNWQFFRIDNPAQLELVARAEKLVGPKEVYFDGTGMLPNRMEPSTLWLDRAAVLKTLREKQKSEAYSIFANSPPKIILWATRMDRIAPVVLPIIEPSYVQVGPNIRMAGRRLDRDVPASFVVPIATTYALYSTTGQPLAGNIEVDGETLDAPLHLERGLRNITLRGGSATALLLPQGSYQGLLSDRPDKQNLFADVYN